MDEIQKKSAQSPYTHRTVGSLNGLFGLHNCMLNKDCEGANNFIFWVNGSFILCRIVELPNSIDKLLQSGEMRVFNFFDSMLPFNSKKDTEMGFMQHFNFRRSQSSE